ncbi:MAG: glutathione S-transferase C-terminal domain-containing protein [Burkholderiales bacterium]
MGLSCFGGPFLAGEPFTAVDAFFAPVAFRVQSYEPSLSARSREYVDRLLSLPSMQEWYLAALNETWRDQAHEDEARRAGVWLQDLRHVAT